MANVTDKSILTAAGKALLAQLNAEEKALVIDKMIFANVPNRPEYPQPDDVVPSNDVVHEAAVEQRGRLSVDSVIYSTTLTSQEGPFEFNWTGAYCSEYGVLVTIDHHALTPKTADEPGVSGNTLVRSVVLEYKDIAEITNITVDASTWQYNATPRMKKMDDDVAQANIDQNGKDWFIEDGFLVTPQASAFNIKAGAGYVSGNRVTLEFDRNVQVPNKPSFIYVDAHREGTPTGEQVTLFDFVVTAEEKDDYTDANGLKHFVCKIAQVLADGSVSDLRPEGESASRNWVEKEIPINKFPVIGEAGRSSTQRFSDYLNIKDFGAVPGADITLALSEAINKQVRKLRITDSFVFNGDISTPKNMTLIFEDGGEISYEAGCNLIINGRVVSDSLPFKDGGGTIRVEGYDIIVGSTFNCDVKTPNEALALVPGRQWQRFNIKISKGTYDEDVLCANKWAASATIGQVIGERTGVYITSLSGNADDVHIKSWLCVSSGGGSFTPMIAEVTIDDHNTKTNETCSCEWYGCPSGAVLGVKFRSGNNSDKAILSYQSNVSVESCDFGDRLYNYLMYTKHGGVIQENSNTRLNVSTSSVGVAKKSITKPLGGPIFGSDFSQMSSDDYQRHSYGGAGVSFTYSRDERTIYGPALLADVVSAYHSYLTSISDYSNNVINGATVASDPIYGMLIQTGTQPSAKAEAWVRRQVTISRQEINMRQQLLVGARIESLGDLGQFDVSIGHGVNQPKLSIRFNKQGVFGVYRDQDGAESLVTIMSNISQVIKTDLIIDLNVIRGDTNQEGVVQFRVRTETFSFYKQTKIFSNSYKTDFLWHVSASDNGQNTKVCVGEIRLFRE